MFLFSILGLTISLALFLLDISNIFDTGLFVMFKPLGFGILLDICIILVLAIVGVIFDKKK